MSLTQPPAPDWWEQQAFFLRRREAELSAEEQWLSTEQTLRFPERSQQREQDYQQQEQELIRQSQARLRRALFGIAWWVLRGATAGRPPLTRTQEGVNLDREIAALRRSFHQLHERDVQWLARQSSTLRLKRDQLEADKQTLRQLAASYGVNVSI